jgi:thiamine biosynthesis protein ThiS
VNRPSEPLHIIVNGEDRLAVAGETVLDLLQALRLPAARVAVERNREILPRPEWAKTQLRAEDRYEIVHFVGGG